MISSSTNRFGRALLPLALTAAAVATSVVATAGFVPEPAPASAPAQCRAENGYAAAFGGRRTFALRPDDLAAIKAAIPADAVLQAERAGMLRRADAALTHRPGSVMDKLAVPSSGDRHDYLSIAPYWWPDPANASGPYVRRDGEVNPERDGPKYDRSAIGRFGSDVEALTLAYYYTDDSRYATKAAELIRAWFLDPATAMNPNANHAQAVRGREDGRAEGVLDTSAFLPVVEGIGLIAPSDALSAAEQSRLEAWFGRYVDWMLTSRNGREERTAHNNHGLWYDAQLVRYALFARRPEIARAVVTAFPKTRVAAQIAPDGRMPAELTRTRSLHYTIYALTPALDVATVGRCLGVDLASTEDDKARTLRRATDHVAAYRGRLDQWPYKELRPDTAELDTLLLRADALWPGRYPSGPAGFPEALTIRRSTTSWR